MVGTCCEAPCLDLAFCLLTSSCGGSPAPEGGGGAGKGRTVLQVFCYTEDCERETFETFTTWLKCHEIMWVREAHRGKYSIIHF